MTNTAFAIMSGSVDSDTDVLLRLYHTSADATAFAKACMDEAWEDAYYDDNVDGSYHREFTVDSDGNPIAIIKRLNVDIEWWRVEETAIY